MPPWVWILVFLLLFVLILVGVMWMTGVFAAVARRQPLGAPSHDTGTQVSEGQGYRQDPAAAPSRGHGNHQPTATLRRRSARPPPALAGPVTWDDTAAPQQTARTRAETTSQPSSTSTSNRPRRGVPPPAAAAWSQPKDGDAS